MRSIKGKRQIRKGMYRAKPIKPDPIALSPLGCAHQKRMRTYEVRSHLFCHPRNDCRGAYKASLFVVCDLVASTPLILQRQKRMISS